MVNVSKHYLPNTIVPSNYAIDITPNLDTFKFEGNVTIDLDINSTTRKIVLHTNELTLHDKTALKLFANKSESYLKPVSTEHDEELQQTTFLFDEDLPQGSQAQLSIQYEGIHNDHMCGFYRSTYTDENGNQKVMVVTQFEVTDARKAFPCWDEPIYKATYDVTLHVSKELTAISNMPVISEHQHASNSNLKTVKFARLPKMSTYLVAFAVGDFEYIQAETQPTALLPEPITVRVYTTTGLSRQGKFALGCATKFLVYLSELFDEPYPLPKLDMLAVHDFSAGAMENMGLITYRTDALLFDEHESSFGTRQSIAIVVAHENAHNWYGNLVTMSTWEDLWLNESFATYVEWHVVDHFFPEWHVWTNFVGRDMQYAFQLDALRESHPIHVSIQSPFEIKQVFDAISYSKGASVIRMMVEWLGKDNFLQGLRKYIQTHKWGNAHHNDLWAALSEASQMDVASFMQNWVHQTGYPVICARREGANITVEQHRFLSSGDVKPEDDSVLWKCPLALYAGDADETARNAKSQILSTRTATYPLPTSFKGPKFFKLNHGNSAFFRTLYEPVDLEAIGEAIVANRQVVPVTDRVGLIKDVFALATSGAASTVDALRVARYFADEDQHIVMESLCDGLASIRSVWGRARKGRGLWSFPESRA